MECRARRGVEGMGRGGRESLIQREKRSGANGGWLRT